MSQQLTDAMHDALNRPMTKRGRRTTIDLPEMTEEEQKGQWVSVSSLSLHTGYTKEAIYQWIRKGKLKARLFRGIVMVPIQSLPPVGD